MSMVIGYIVTFQQLRTWSIFPISFWCGVRWCCFLSLWFFVYCWFESYALRRSSQTSATPTGGAEYETQRLVREREVWWLFRSTVITHVSLYLTFHEGRCFSTLEQCTLKQFHHCHLYCFIYLARSNNVWRRASRPLTTRGLTFVEGSIQLLEHRGEASFFLVTVEVFLQKARWSVLKVVRGSSFESPYKEGCMKAMIPATPRGIRGCPAKSFLDDNLVKPSII